MNVILHVRGVVILRHFSVESVGEVHGSFLLFNFKTVRTYLASVSTNVLVMLALRMTRASSI